MKDNRLIEMFRKEKRWVNWRAVEKKNGKISKIPYDTDGNLASSTNPETWSDYATAQFVSDNISIAFTSDQDLLGIDIDNVIVDGKLPDDIATFVTLVDSYTEISPSGNGLHLYLKLKTPLTLEANRHEPYELYTSGRFFTVTQNVWGEEKDVRTVTYKEVMEIIGSIGYPWKKKEETAPLPIGKDTPAQPAIHLDDSTIVTKMFASKNGKDIERLYHGDISSYGDDASVADLGFLSHLAFWCGKDASQMERIWLSSPLGSREKAKRKDYRRRTIDKAISGCTEVYTPHNVEMKKIDEDEELELLYTVNSKKDVVYTQNTENMCRVMRKHPDFKKTLRYDTFKNSMEIFSKGKWRNIEDNDAVNIQTAISILFSAFSKVGKDMIFDAMIKVAKENAMDSASDWITSLVWDKKKRLDTWLCDTYGVLDDVYHRAVASNWLKGLVKRLIQPGCKFDYVLVLEGPQGTKKSTSLGVLGRDWHVETTMSTESKDFFMQFSGKAIIEFSEGETLSRTEVKRMKAIITMQSDKYRPPYERTSQDFPRRCVFAMTTNQTEYLKDETGNRRWLPITVLLDEANIEWLEANRDQLFAEAYQRVIIDKETIYEFPKEETTQAQESRRIREPNTDLVVDWYYNVCNEDQRLNGITVHQVYKEALHSNFPSKPLNRFDEMNIADILKTALKLTKRRAMIGGIQASRWFDDRGKEIPKDHIQVVKVPKEDFGVFSDPD